MESLVSLVSHGEAQALTPEHDTTRPMMSIPASASAVLAAMEPAAMQPSIPSFSTIVRKISIVDFGNSSSRTDDTIAWCMATAIDLSSASWMLCVNPA